MNQEIENAKQPYYRRSRRAAWWASAVCGVLGMVSFAEEPFDQGFGGLCLFLAAALFVWGLDYHRRLKPVGAETTPARR